jgi:hypothetical protein
MDLRMEDLFFIFWALMGVLILVWGIRKVVLRKKGK